MHPNLGDVAEWLRRRPAKALGSARVSSNLAVIVILRTITAVHTCPETDRLKFPV